MFFLKKNNFFLPFFNATFQCGRYGVFKKNLKYFFDPKKVKKWASKVAHNRPKPFFSQSRPQPTAHSPQPRIDISYYKNVPRRICFPIYRDLMCNITVMQPLKMDAVP